MVLACAQAAEALDHIAKTILDKAEDGPVLEALAHIRIANCFNLTVLAWHLTLTPWWAMKDLMASPWSCQRDTMACFTCSSVLCCATNPNATTCWTVMTSCPSHWRTLTPASPVPNSLPTSSLSLLGLSHVAVGTQQQSLLTLFAISSVASWAINQCFLP